MAARRFTHQVAPNSAHLPAAGNYHSSLKGERTPAAQRAPTRADVVSRSCRTLFLPGPRLPLLETRKQEGGAARSKRQRPGARVVGGPRRRPSPPPPRHCGGGHVTATATPRSYLQLYPANLSQPPSPAPSLRRRHDRGTNAIVTLFERRQIKFAPDQLRLGPRPIWSSTGGFSSCRSSAQSSPPSLDRSRGGAPRASPPPGSFSSCPTRINPHDVGRLAVLAH